MCQQLNLTIIQLVWPYVLGSAFGFIVADEKGMWMFCITGIVTVIWAVAIGIFLPGNPAAASLITAATEDDRS